MNRISDRFARPRRISAWVCLLASALCGCAAVAAETITWRSPATDADLTLTVLAPDPADKPLPTVFYFQNLPIPRLGQEPDEPILNDLRAAGHLVVTVDYARREKATAPFLAADVLKLRQDLIAKNRSLLAEHKIDLDRVFILIEGYRLKREVVFAEEGKRVLAMDIAYPSKPAAPVAALLEYSCDNANRMGSGSLVFCRDTLLELGQLNGFAVAMADHPVAPPYKGLDDPMPQALDRAKAAASALRALKTQLPLTGRIGAIGFSRGGPFAAMVAATGDADAALVHGNRYDYLRLDPADPMLKRFEKAWGPLEANREKWAAHGAMPLLTRESSPMYLNTSAAESAEYRLGLAQLAARLEELGVPHRYAEDADTRGHRVSTDPDRLTDLFSFLKKVLAP